jgi:hypothetical protein
MRPKIQRSATTYSVQNSISDTLYVCPAFVLHESNVEFRRTSIQHPVREHGLLVGIVLCVFGVLNSIGQFVDLVVVRNTIGFLFRKSDFSRTAKG